MSSDLQNIQYAGQLIELARGEETPTGNPLAAARYYATAMEIVISIASRHAATMDDLQTRLTFLSQIRSRVEVYAERAELLLQVAAETGLLDKPGAGGGLQAALPGPDVQVVPPALFGTRGSSGMRGAGNGSTSLASPPVLGIPLPPQQPSPSAGGGSDDGPAASYYIASDSGFAAPPPPPEVDLDDLLKNLGAPKGV